MRKIVGIFILSGLLLAGWLIAQAEAGVVIKVRALNPLETQESVLINYPLPPEIGKDDILTQKITYSMDHSEDEEPPKSHFQISFNEEKKIYFIDDELVLMPREVVTLEVHVKDVWVIDNARIEDLKREVENLFTKWESDAEKMPSKEAGNNEGDEEKGREKEEAAGDGEKEETKEVALMMKEEILGRLGKIMERQKNNNILNVGVETHISSYNDNIEDLLQVQQDIVLLAELMRTDDSKDEGREEGEEGMESETEELQGPETDDPGIILDQTPDDVMEGQGIGQ